MSFRSNIVLKSYVKTTVACLVLVPLALLFTLLGLYWLPNGLGSVVAALTVFVALGAATLACTGAVVLARYRRGVLGERDLFLELNRSREPAAIRASTVARISRVRRWFAERLLGHDLVVGDLVEIKTWAEIRATLDERGCLEQLPFMPEMLPMCGRRAHVFRSVHRLFDYRKTRRMRHMDGAVLLVGAVCDGSNHGGCEAACHTIWKSAWLRRVERSDHMADAPVSSDRSDPAKDVTVLQFGSSAPRYACQLTQLNVASQPIGNWSAINFLRPLVSGNVAPAAFAVGWLTHIFNELQYLRQGVSFPAFEVATPNGGGHEDTRLEAGDSVIVRSSAEIRATLNDQLVHRGLGFEPDMLKHCGRRCCVQAEVKRLIDIVTGEMRTMKTPAYILRDIHFSGERQIFNAQYEPLFWRGVWLQPDKIPVLPHHTKTSLAIREALSISADHARQITAGVVPPRGLLRRLVERPLRAMGVEPIPLWDVSDYAHNYVHAELLREVFDAKAIDCVFDVGAFNGHFGNFLRRKVGFRGTILSFEPQPEPFRALDKASREDEHWHVFPVALGAQPGEFEMNVMNKLWFSSFLAPSAATPQNMASRNTVESTIRARIERLADRFDELAATHGFKRPFLKMDTQGFDLQVLQGALPRIEHFLGLQSEVSMIQIYAGMPDWKEALAEYQKVGFAVCGFFPVSRDGQLRAVELDAVMVRND